MVAAVAAAAAAASDDYRANSGGSSGNIGSANLPIARMLFYRCENGQPESFYLFAPQKLFICVLMNPFLNKIIRHKSRFFIFTIRTEIVFFLNEAGLNSWS